MRGRPDLYTRYRDEMAMLKNPTQKFFASLLILGLLILGYIADDYWILLLTAAVFIDTLSAPANSKFLISSKLLTPPPTVRGIKHFSAVFLTVSNKIFLFSFEAVMSI